MQHSEGDSHNNGIKGTESLVGVEPQNIADRLKQELVFRSLNDEDIRIIQDYLAEKDKDADIETYRRKILEKIRNFKPGKQNKDYTDAIDAILHLCAMFIKYEVVCKDELSRIRIAVGKEKHKNERAAKRKKNRGKLFSLEGNKYTQLNTLSSSGKNPMYYLKFRMSVDHLSKITRISKSKWMSILTEVYSEFGFFPRITEKNVEKFEMLLKTQYCQLPSRYGERLIAEVEKAEWDFVNDALDSDDLQRAEKIYDFTEAGMNGDYSLQRKIHHEMNPAFTVINKEAVHAAKMGKIKKEQAALLHSVEKSKSTGALE